MTAWTIRDGVLRAMPRSDGRTVRVSEMSDPEPILAERGWETPALIERAAAARAALIAAEAGGEWWRDDADDPFLALLAGQRVRCAEPAFYAGWGLTDDAPGVARRPFTRTLDEIFAGACLIATSYSDPFRNAPASFEEVLAIVAEWRRIERINRGIGVCVGMSFWKRRRVADFLRSSTGVPVFRRSAAAAVAAARGKAVACWTSRMPAGLEDATKAAGIPLIRVEDGFVRSVGLGSDFLPPASLVLDGRGMYFDPHTPSDLETILRETEFDPPLLTRARGLADQLVQRGVTKYNLGARALPIDWPPGRRRILVPGQVEDDLSVVLGGGDIRDNLALLAAARAAAPDAFILYKPHPDVLAGHRKGAVAEADALRYADRVVTDAATASLLGEIDEVHTLTSLAGFEALLRGRRVAVYGRPWYAGWGLTDDRLVIGRGRKLALEELVAGALIVYPRYLDPVTRLPCGPETIIERLDHPEAWRAGLLVSARRMQGVAARWCAERMVRSPSPANAGRKGRV
jgi:capsular polysaccharide export protein